MIALDCRVYTIQVASVGLRYFGKGTERDTRLRVDCSSNELGIPSLLICAELRAESKHVGVSTERFLAGSWTGIVYRWYKSRCMTPFKNAQVDIDMAKSFRCIFRMVLIVVITAFRL